MKSNILIKGIAIVIVSVLVVVLFKGRKSEETQVDVAAAGEGYSEMYAVESGPAIEDNGLTQDPLDEKFLKEEYGVDVDSPVETMRTLTNETRAVREDSAELQEELTKMKQETSKLLQMEESINNRIASRFNNAERVAEEKQRQLKHTQDLTQNLIDRLEGRLEQLQNTETKPGQKSANGYDIGDAGIPSGLGYDDQGIPVNYDEVIWTNPIDAVVDPRNPTDISLPDFSKVSDNLPDIAKDSVKDKKKTKEERLIKAYTISENSTLLGSVSMTALVGRIPVGGQVVDPYPFKIIVGEENLSSNGIHIPDVTGIKMSGIAKGDWTMSCVSGEIRSMTFTFQDGTIVTIPEPGTKSTEALAWFSDANGIPCITGKRITNAPSYLSQRIALSAASSYANAEAQAQITSSTNALGGSNSVVTGDPKILAKNTAISTGLNEATDWLDARQENSFDAVYVPPGTKLALHIKEELRIDYDPEGRKVNHYANQQRHTDVHLD